MLGIKFGTLIRGLNTALSAMPGAICIACDPLCESRIRNGEVIAAPGTHITTPAIRVGGTYMGDRISDTLRQEPRSR